MKLLFCVLFALTVMASSQAQEAANRYPFAKGKIEKLEAASQRIVVRTPYEVITFTVTERTYLIENGAIVGFEKLRVGDAVKINFYTNETRQAIIRRLKIDHPEVLEK